MEQCFTNLLKLHQLHVAKLVLLLIHLTVTVHLLTQAYEFFDVLVLAVPQVSTSRFKYPYLLCRLTTVSVLPMPRHDLSSSNNFLVFS